MTLGGGGFERERAVSVASLDEQLREGGSSALYGPASEMTFDVGALRRNGLAIRRVRRRLVFVRERLG